MHIPTRVHSIPPGPIDALNARARRLREQGAQVISLGQAVPGFPMVAAAVARARAALDEPDTHVYSPDAGLPEARAAVSAMLAEHGGLPVDPESEIILTAGANHAFMLAALTLFEPGDRVLLPAPVYFNHAMAVRLVGAVPVEVPLAEETGFQLRLEDLQPFLEPAPRALVVVTPNNPTGAVYDPAELARIGQALATRGIALIQDETYRFFVYEEAAHLSLAARPELRPHVVTLGSFSKTFGMTGWRLGYFVAGGAVVREALKVQDTLLICAPVIAQKALLGALAELGPHGEVARRRAILDGRRRDLVARLERIPGLGWHPTCGALFALARVQGCRDSAQLAHDILEQAHLITIPGSVFGPHGEGYLRLSYGSVDLPELEEACRRLEEFFGSR